MTHPLLPRLALYQPDIPQNVGAAMRLCACMGIGLDLIEPFGFPWDERKIRQSGMDYTDLATVTRHKSWDGFLQDLSLGEGRGPHATRGPRAKPEGPTLLSPPRLVLLTTKGAVPYTQFEFRANDILLAGRESAGVPDDVHEKVDARVVIEMTPGARSLNVIIASAMVLGEAIRQVGNHYYLQDTSARSS
jgi:tRNA (cytidine/uridine-2'-O-)-methyltransferase